MTERELHDLERDVRAAILRRLGEDVVECSPETALIWANVYGALTFDDARDAMEEAPNAA